uniref:Uncharacterized protein n=1 Tax=Rhizophora mucronata TaxID=61149 RepID=A0A2P2N3H2_RHIMU
MQLASYHPNLIQLLTTRSDSGLACRELLEWCSRVISP